MDRADVDDHAHVRLGDRRQLRDLPGAAHRHLEHEHLRVRRRSQQRERQADLRVVVLRARHRAPLRARDRRKDVLRRGLARRASDPDHLCAGCAELAPPRSRERLQRRQRVRMREHRAARGVLAERCARRLGVLVRHQHAPRPCPQRLCRVLGAMRALARQAHEQIAAGHRARVDHRAQRAHLRILSAWMLDRLRPRLRGQPRCVPAPHERPLCKRQRLARHRHIVERHLATARELLALLVALARDHQHVARACRPDRLVDRDRAVCDRAHELAVPARAPRRP